MSLRLRAVGDTAILPHDVADVFDDRGDVGHERKTRGRSESGASRRRPSNDDVNGQRQAFGGDEDIGGMHIPNVEAFDAQGLGNGSVFCSPFSSSVLLHRAKHLQHRCASESITCFQLPRGGRTGRPGSLWAGGKILPHHKDSAAHRAGGINHLSCRCFLPGAASPAVSKVVGA